MISTASPPAPEARSARQHLIEGMMNAVEQFFDASVLAGAAGAFPPYDIVARRDGSLRLDVFCPGFTLEELSVEEEGGELRIRGRIAPPVASPNADPDELLVHCGIPRRSFTLRFPLRANAKPVNCEYVNGIFSVVLAMEKLGGTSA